MSTPPTTSPPAGWYPDEQHPGHVRRWSGTAWTADRRVVPQRPMTAPASGTGRGGAASTSNIPARIALICGILSILGLRPASLLGLVFAILGLVRAARATKAGLVPIGRSMSIWALVLSCVILLVTVAAMMIG